MAKTKKKPKLPKVVRRKPNPQLPRLARLAAADPETPQDAPESPPLPAPVAETNGHPTPVGDDQERQARLEACGAELEAALNKYRCSIVPQIVQQLEPVGHTGQTVQISATWSLATLI